MAIGVFTGIVFSHGVSVRHLALPFTVTLLGELNRRQSERVEYCIGCHLAAEKTDHLYFIPSDFRIHRDN